MYVLDIIIAIRSWQHVVRFNNTLLLCVCVCVCGGGGGGGGGYIGFTPSVRLSVRPSRIPCPLCSFYSSGWIHFIFIHLIKQLQKVCRLQSFLQNFKIRNFGYFFKFVTLTLCFFDLGSDVNH